MKRKNIIIIALSFVLLVEISFLYYYYYYYYNDNVIFSLNNPINQIIEVNAEYIELGTEVIANNIDMSKNIRIDVSNLDTKKLGNYIIKYSLFFNKKNYICYRKIKVVDTTKPNITLVDGNNTMLIGEEYKELGYSASDNYDGDITNKVIIENKIDNKKEGEYEVVYKVSDSSNNTTSITRKVKVKKPVVVMASYENNKQESKKTEVTDYSNTISKNKFVDNGIYLEGYIKNSQQINEIKLVGDNNYNYTLTTKDKNYKVTIDLTNVVNGNYSLYINSEKLLNKLDYLEKINRAKIGNKLVTINYINDEVSITIEDFSYQYDILIDSGHGGDDPGATNEYIYEKDMNLIVSKYEKCRYQSHGLSVYMTRNDGSYGAGYGPTDLKRLYRRSYEIGYYGAVSKIIYSNHHNSINNNWFSGYEIILPGAIKQDNYNSELSIYNKWVSMYPITEEHLRFYARDYDSEAKYSKKNSEVYSFKDYYAIIRLPYQLFNIKSVIYEASYLSNNSDFKWYWQEKNWLRISESKIETYVTSLGLSYNSDNTNCL